MLNVMFKQEDTISINHNWYNGSNIQLVYDALLKAADEVEEEIHSFGVEEADDEQFGVVLNCYYGMNFTGFRRLLETIAKRRESKVVPLMFHASEDCSLCAGKQSPCNRVLHEDLDRKIALDMLNEMSETATN